MKHITEIILALCLCIALFISTSTNEKNRKTIAVYQEIVSIQTNTIGILQGTVDLQASIIEDLINAQAETIMEKK